MAIEYQFAQDDFVQLVANGEWNRTKNSAHRAYAEALKRIETAAIKGGRPKKASREFLNNKQCQLSALIKSMKDTEQPNSVERFKGLVNPWRSGPHTVGWRLKPTPKGGQRTICNLPIPLKAAHKMLGHSLRAQLLPHDGLFGIAKPKKSKPRSQGYTRDDAIRYVQLLYQSGFTHLAEVDIVDCFPSYNPDNLYTLPLPEEVTRKTLDTRNMKFQYREQGRITHPVPIGSIIDNIRNPHGPSGLLQGSPASSAILAHSLNKVLFELPVCEDVKVIVCFDNIVIASRTSAGLLGMIENLAGTLRQCCAGPFELHPPVYANDDGFEFMGYHLSADGQTIGIAPDKLIKLEARINELESLSPENPHMDIVKIWKAIASFANGYSAVTDVRAELKLYLDNTEGYLDASDRRDLVAIQNLLFCDAGTPEREFINQILRM